MALCILLVLLWQVDKGISSEIVRSILAERANWPCLAAQSAVKVSDLYFYLLSVSKFVKCHVKFDICRLFLRLLYLFLFNKYEGIPCKGMLCLF